mgnify:FL=1
MRVEFTSETYNGNEYEVKADRYTDRDYVDGRCVRCELIIDDIEIIINGVEIDFDDLREANKQMILEEIQEAE